MLRFYQRVKRGGPRERKWLALASASHCSVHWNVPRQIYGRSIRGGKNALSKGGAHDCEAVTVFQLQRGEVGLSGHHVLLLTLE